MVNIIKNVTRIKNIYTYFEFNGCSDWDGFDCLLSILTNQMGCQVIDKLDGIYSRHYTLEKKSFIFKLMYHEDFGNCLCNQYRKDKVYYKQLEEIANEVVSKLG